MSHSAALVASQRVLVLATESLDMMRNVTGVVKDSLDRADAYVSFSLFNRELLANITHIDGSDDYEPLVYNVVNRKPVQTPLRISSWHHLGNMTLAHGGEEVCIRCIPLTRSMMSMICHHPIRDLQPHTRMLVVASLLHLVEVPIRLSTRVLRVHRLGLG